mmetsp:Transcript_843/g.1516  ORF Transcript_843/g.1516 Transcript_843/m.1516 type:complete len:105 (-) Transcript_843:187-501(-)
MIPRAEKAGSLGVLNLHDLVKSNLKGLNQKNSFAPSEKNILVPQFKVGDVANGEEDLENEARIINFKVKGRSDEEPSLFVKQYLQQSAFELFAPQVSNGNLLVE